MPSALASFAAGVFVATLVLTHDASRGDDLLLARGFLAPVGSNVSDVAPARAEASFADAPLLGAPREGADPSAADAPAPPALDDRSGSRGTPRALDALASTGSCVAPSDGATASAVASSSFASSSFASCAAPAHPADPAPPARFAEDLTPREAFAAAMASTKLALALFRAPRAPPRTR